MAGKGPCVAILAFATAGCRRADAGAGCSRVAGQAAIGGMDLSASSEWRTAGVVAADTVGRYRA